MSSTNHVAKIIVLGAAATGKSQVVDRLTLNIFSAPGPSLGADFGASRRTCDGDEVSLQVWDTASQQPFESKGAAFYRTAASFVFVASYDNAESLASLATIAAQCVEAAGDSKKRIRGILLLNKADVADKKITAADARSVMAELGALGVDFIIADPVPVCAKADGEFGAERLGDVFDKVAREFVVRQKPKDTAFDDMFARLQASVASHKADEAAAAAAATVVAGLNKKAAASPKKPRRRTGVNFFGFKI